MQAEPYHTQCIYFAQGVASVNPSHGRSAKARQCHRHRKHSSCLHSCQGNRQLLEAAQAPVCKGKEVSLLASLWDAKIYLLLQHEHRAGNSQHLIYHFLIYFSPCQKNLFIREVSGGSCPAFPQYHADNRRKQNPSLCLEPLAPLITLPKFSSGSSHCSFNLCHSCCLSSYPASNRHNQGSLEEPLLAYSREPSAPWNEGSTADNQEKMHRCSKTQRVSIREPSSLFRLWCIWTSEAAGFSVAVICATCQQQRWVFRLDAGAGIEMFIVTFLLSPLVPPWGQSPQPGHHWQGHIARAGSSWGIPLHHCNYRANTNQRCAGNHITLWNSVQTQMHQKPN